MSHFKMKDLDVKFNKTFNNAMVWTAQRSCKNVTEVCRWFVNKNLPS